MKKTLIILTLAIIAISCKNPSITENNYENQVQGKFDAFLKLKVSKEYDAINDIQKKEFFEKYDNELSSLIDTNKVFVNWQAQIEDIKTNDYGKSTEVSCKLSYKPEEYREVSFYCSYVVENSKLKTDSLYNKIKKIGDFSTVYFDGFIVKNLDNKVVYVNDDESLKLSYPNFKFNLLNITEKKRENTLSKNLNNAVNINFKVFELLKQKVNKTITEKEWKRKTEDLGLEKMEKSLNPEEKKYSNLIKQYLVSDFMYH
ncbi:hypothetical protein [Flavobacterium luteum]|uniref:Lipoprotein n=1 Tax=Flavobacterium luteum TaxID=2026654 RepID=A0A7J5AKQ8_9FLAO|nr:hypothetical protein [Flavobacterium luteum]KAB1158135.1 hypothetical protein F6464_03370 [Flavobacterium luteum]